MNFWSAAKARALEIARKQVQDRIYKAPDPDGLETSTEVLMFDLRPWLHVHDILEDGTKVWLTEAERWRPDG